MHVDEDHKHTIERFVILLYDGQAPQPMSTRHAANCLQRSPAHATDNCRPQAARPTSCVPGWACLGAGCGSCTSIALSN